MKFRIEPAKSTKNSRPFLLRPVESSFCFNIRVTIECDRELSAFISVGALALFDLPIEKKLILKTPKNARTCLFELLPLPPLCLRSRVLSSPGFEILRREPLGVSNCPMSDLTNHELYFRRVKSNQGK